MHVVLICLAADKMTQKLSGLDKAVFAKACADAKKAVETIEKTVATLEFGSPKVLKGVCNVVFAPVPGSKFVSIKGTVQIKASMAECVKYMQSFGEFDEKAPKSERKGRLCNFNYYLNDEQKQAHEKQKSGCPVDGAQYVSYQIVESPSVLVSHREFVFVDTTKNVSESGKERWIVYDSSAGFTEKFTDAKVVRGESRSMVLFEQEEGSVKVTSWVHADPCGSVPALIFNHLLDDQMDFIIDMKNDLEK